MTEAAPIPSVVVTTNGESWLATRGERVFGPRQTCLEVWLEATAGQPRVAATILDATFRPDTPAIVWGRACNRLGKARLEPSKLRLVTLEDVEQRRASKDVSDPRPKIYVETGELPRLVYETLDALAERAELYRRAGEIVEPVTAKRAWQTVDSPASLVMSLVTPTLIQLRAGVVCRFVRALILGIKK